MKTTYHTNKIWTIENFLSKEECDNLILRSEELGYEEATVSLKSGAQMMKNIRDNYRLIYTDIELANSYWERLKDTCPASIDNWTAKGLNEQFRFYKYDVGQRFKRHIDGRYERSKTEESRITFLIYLNDDYEGGSTDFDNISIKPKSGTALCFIHEQKHEGMALIKGTKYVLRSDVMYERC